MKRRHCRHIWRRVEKTMIGVILLAIGIGIILCVALPSSVWLILVALIMIYIGYKLFCRF